MQKTNIHYCTRCGNFTDKELCDVCAAPDRQSIICVVKAQSVLGKRKSFNGISFARRLTLEKDQMTLISNLADSSEQREN